MIEFEVGMSYEQYFECNRLFCVKTTWSRRFCYLLMQYLYPVIGAIFAVLAAIIWIQERRFSASIAVLISCSMFLLWGKFGFTRRVRKLFDKVAANLIGTMRLTAEGLRFERKNGTARTDYKWKAFESWIERPDMFMVFPGPISFIRIPKDKLTPSEQEQVRGWLSNGAKRIG